MGERTNMKTADVNQKLIYCEQCGCAVPLWEQGYSLRAFKKTLCREKCQKEERVKTMPPKLALWLNNTL